MLSDHLLRRHHRRFVPGACLALVVLCTPEGLFSLSQASQTVASLPELEVGRVLDGNLSGGQTISYRITANAGDFIWVIVEPRGILLASTLRRPDSTVQEDVYYSNDDFRPQTVVAIAEVSGAFRMDVRAGQPTHPSRPY